MDAHSMQLKMTLPLQLYDYLESRAHRFGLTMSSYVKHLILNDVKNEEVPTYPMSPTTEITAIHALADHRHKRTKKLESVDRLLQKT